MEIRMLNKLPNSIQIDDRKYFINTNFRNMILFETELKDINGKEDDEKTKFIIESLNRFCPLFFKEKRTYEEINKLKDQFLWFYTLGRRENYHIGGGNGTPLEDVFSYEYDDEYLFSAFYSQYRLDLSSVKNLHWWKFKALEKGLNDTNKIEKIKSYRAYKGKDEDMKKLRDYWKLPLDKKLQEHLDKTAEMLMKYNKK